MPGHPYTGSSKSCCIPSTTPPSSTLLCGCSTSSTSLIPQKVQIDLSRVFQPFHAECLYCTDLNGSYILRPSTENWLSTLCIYTLRFTKAFTKNPALLPIPPELYQENCTRLTDFMWFAALDIIEGSSQARWWVRLFAGHYPYDVRWTWTWYTQNQVPIPVPWSYPCLASTHSPTTGNAQFISPVPGDLYGIDLWPCHAAWDSTSWDSTVYTLSTGYLERDHPLSFGMSMLATDFYGWSTKFPHITITPSSST